MRRLPALLAPLAALALALAGCGAQAADLFVLQRSGEGPGARLTLLVADDGTVTCNGERSHELPSARLLDARESAREIADDARAHKRYPARKGSILRYRVRSQDGTVAWADTSRPLPVRYLQLAFFARRVSKDVCGLSR
jgi:hypothetical protein